jgi:hypothetical protein
MSTCAGLTKRGLPCTRMVTLPHTRCKTHRVSVDYHHGQSSAHNGRPNEHAVTPTTALAGESDAWTTESRISPEIGHASMGLYDELLRYHIENPHHGMYEQGDDTFQHTMRDENDETIGDSGSRIDHVRDGRLLCRQQDDEYEMSLRKDRAISMWKRCRMVVFSLIELRRWQRSHLCSSVIRSIQRYETLCREIVFSSSVSQPERNAIGVVIQKNKNVERWCKRWLETRMHHDWDVSKLSDAQLTRKPHVVSAATG